MKRNPRLGYNFAVTALILGVTSFSSPARAQDKVQVPRDPYAALVKLEVNPAVADGHPVLVLDGKGKPFAGVSVVVVDTKAVGRTRRRAISTAASLKYPRDAEAGQLALLALHGKRYVTDENGETRFAKIYRGMVVAIRGKTVAATNVFLRTGREPRQIRITLKPKPGIDVIVVSDRGRPVFGVPVRLIWRGEYGSSSGGSNKKTGTGGHVRLDPLQQRRGGTMIPYIEAAVPTKKRIAVKLDPETFVNDPDNPIRLTLPPFGMVRVYVVDDKKRPLMGVESVTLKPRTFDDRHDSFTISVKKGDYVTFSIVEVGLKFEAYCRFKGMSRPQRVRSDGPRHPMDMRVVTLSGVTAPASVTFRILDQKGQPVANETIGVIFSMPNNFRGHSQKTDKDGLCTLSIVEQFVGDEDGHLTITRRARGRKLVYRGAARVSLEKSSKKPNLGDLQLVDEKLLVAGQVVDKDGKPVKGVNVSVPHGYRLQDRASSSSSGSSTSGESKFFSHRMATDKDGRFEFREFDADPVNVALSLDNWYSNTLGYYIISGKDAEPGEKNHKLVVGRTSKLAGSFKGVPKNASYSGQIEIQDKDGVRVNNLWVQSRNGGVFELRRCPPGEYTFAFKLPNARTPFLTVNNIKVKEGKTCKDPRLQGIDLSKYCRMIKITVLKADKTPVRGTTVWQMRPKGGASGRSTNAHGVVNLCVPLEGVNLSIVASTGLFQVQNFENQKEDLTVTLKPGWQAKFKIKKMPKLPDNLQFQATMSAIGADRTAWGMRLGMSRRRPYVDESGEFDLAVARSGKYRVTLHPKVAEDSNRFRNLGGNSLTFEVEVKKDAKGIQAFNLELDEGMLEVVNEYIELAKEKEKDR
jgi:protocatechuate 3,4-dioxygenase beta subunit